MTYSNVSQGLQLARQNTGTKACNIAICASHWNCIGIAD